MARDYDGNDTSDRAVITNYAAINSLITLSASIQAYFNTGVAEGAVPRLVDKRTTPAGWGFWFNTVGDDDVVSFHNDWTTTDGNWNWVAEPLFTKNAWHNHVITYDGGSTTNDPIYYVDSVDKVAGISETSTPAGSLLDSTDDLTIGNNSGTNRAWPGRLAEFGLWNVILNSAETAALAAGYSPLMVRPGALVCYVPMLGNVSPEPNLVAASPAAVTGLVKIAHPHMIYPTSSPIQFPVAAVGGAEEFLGRQYPQGVMRGVMRGAA